MRCLQSNNSERRIACDEERWHAFDNRTNWADGHKSKIFDKAHINGNGGRQKGQRILTKQQSKATWNGMVEARVLVDGFTHSHLRCMYNSIP